MQEIKIIARNKKLLLEHPGITDEELKALDGYHELTCKAAYDVDWDEFFEELMKQYPKIAECELELTCIQENNYDLIDGLFQ